MDDAEPVIGEVEGYRAFEIRGDRLWSIGYGPYEWQPDANQAHCDLVAGARSRRKVWVNDPTSPTGLAQREREVSHGRIPSPSCTCGFWFYKSEAVCRERFAVLGGTANSQSNGYGDFGTDVGFVIGKVSAWGRAIEGADGYRSEFARIGALVTPHPDRFAQLLRHYKVAAVRPKSKADEGLSTAWITKVRGDGQTQINLNRPDAGETDNEVGAFFVDPGVDVPRVGALVTVRFERRGSIRWIGSFTVHGENGE